jgi:3-hydroxyacyl-CoA dehydrogenase
MSSIKNRVHDEKWNIKSKLFATVAALVNYSFQVASTSDRLPLTQSQNSTKIPRETAVNHRKALELFPIA